MNKDKFSIFLTTIVKNICIILSNDLNISYMSALDKVYNSKVYSMLGSEDTKVWYYSKTMLADILKEELESGKLSFEKYQ